MKSILLIMLMSVLALADVGKVTVVKGMASIDRDLKVIKVQNGMGLFKQDIVETTQGRMQMHFVDNTVISLGRESRFVIKEYLYTEDSDKVAATFRVEKGFVKTITGAIGKMMPEMFVFETATTKITPHGTIWSMEVGDKSEIYKVLDGRVILAFNDGLDKKVELNAGESMILYIGLKGNKRVIKSSKKSKIAKNVRYENSLEQRMSILKEDQAMNQGMMVDKQGNLVEDPGFDTSSTSSTSGISGFDDGNNGHGNDPDGFDPSNPGKGHSK